MEDKNNKQDSDGCLKFYGNPGEELLKLSKDGFYYKGERVDDIHDVYNRFNEWLSKVESDKTNN